MYTMKQACEKTGLSYETLKFYCNQGLVPNVKRDGNNRRVFADREDPLSQQSGFRRGIKENSTV